MGGQRVWLFDLDNTLHDAALVFRALNVAMTDYIVRELAVDEAQADRLRRHYWRRYGATLLGLVRHHGIEPAHFLHHTHLLPDLEARLHTHPYDLAAVRRLPGTKILLTNGPQAYARRVLAALRLGHCFDGIVAIDQMRMFGQLRPKPDARMFRALLARLKVPASRCVLVEDTLAHQKTAHGLGMRTVWMQRWLAAAGPGPQAGHRLARRPPYVCDRIRALARLPRLRSRRPSPP